jgi:restriction system protein
LDYHRTLLALDELKRNIAPLATMDRRMFEQVVAELFRAKGFKVEVTKKTRDGGTDIIGVVNNDGVPFKIFVQCKRNDPGNPTGDDVVRSAYGVHQTSNGPNKTIVVSATYFTKDAMQFRDSLAQSSWHLDLRDYDDIVQWVKNYSF